MADKTVAVEGTWTPEPMDAQTVWGALEKAGFYGERLMTRIAESQDLWVEVVALVAAVYAHNLDVIPSLVSVPPNVSQKAEANLTVYIGENGYSEEAINTAARSLPNPWDTLFAIATDAQQYNIALRSQALKEANQ